MTSRRCDAVMRASQGVEMLRLGCLALNIEHHSLHIKIVSHISWYVKVNGSLALTLLRFIIACFCGGV